MTFFTQFPKTTYSIESDGVQTDITDIYRYVDVVERSSQNVLAYKIADVFDGERPDNLSQRLYGTPDYTGLSLSPMIISRTELRPGQKLLLMLRPIPT